MHAFGYGDERQKYLNLRIERVEDNLFKQMTLKNALELCIPFVSPAKSTIFPCLAT